MKVLCIDAGNVQSAYIIFCTTENRVVRKNLLPNEDFIKEIESMRGWTELPKWKDGNGSTIHSSKLSTQFDEVAIEKIISMGMPVGDTTFETVFQNGRLYQMFVDKFNIIPNLYTRLNIKMHLCSTTRAKDGNVRAALVNRYGEPSTKKNPHNQYNELTDKIYFGTHFWSCLAVCMYHIEPHHSKPIITDGYGTIKK